MITAFCLRLFQPSEMVSKKVSGGKKSAILGDEVFTATHFTAGLRHRPGHQTNPYEEFHQTDQVYLFWHHVSDAYMCFQEFLLTET